MLSAQFEAYLTDDLWLRLAGQANAMGRRLADGLAGIAGVSQSHSVDANMMFPTWAAGGHARLLAAGARYSSWGLPDGREGARLVTSWNTTNAHVDEFLAALRG